MPRKENMREFESLTECIEYNHSTLVLDLKNFIGPCSFDQYCEFFKPPTPGVYFKGEITPILDFTKSYYVKKDLVKTSEGFIDYLNSTKITKLDDLKNVKSDIVDEYGIVKINSRELYKILPSLTEDPGYLYGSVRAAAYFAISFLSTWCRHSRVTPPYHYKDVFKPNAWKLVEDETLDVFKQLKFVISTFVGEDDLFLYYYRMVGTVLYIQKNVDYRVYDYYVRKFQHV